MILVLVSTILMAIPVQASSQYLASQDALTANVIIPEPEKQYLTYEFPTPSVTVKNYAFDAVGPYAFAGTALTAGLDQTTNTPPEWKQGVRGYAERFGSDFGIAAVATTSRYGLAAVFKQDPSYYRCECSGVLPRLNHAVLSTFTARRGQDGRRVFSLPALVAPYVGATTAVYGWYPTRFGAKDALRMGNYSLLLSVGANIALEFIYRGPHSVFSRMRLNSPHHISDSGSQ